MKRLDFARDQQWEPLPIMEPHRAGDYVEYEEAMEEIERLKAELTAETDRRWEGNRLAQAEQDSERSVLQAEIERLTAERGAARELLSRNIAWLTGDLLERIDSAAGGDVGEYWSDLFAEAADAIRELQAERDAALLECNEQARLLGMGAQREAGLMAEVERARAALLKYGSHDLGCWNDECSCGYSATLEGK